MGVKGARGEKSVVRPERLELPTYWFEASRSIQLSYGRARSFRQNWAAYAVVFKYQYAVELCETVYQNLAQKNLRLRELAVTNP